MPDDFSSGNVTQFANFNENLTFITIPKILIKIKGTPLTF